MTLSRDEWWITPQEARVLQEQVRDQVVERPPPDFRPTLVAGADVSAARRSRVVAGGIVVLRLEDRTEVDSSALVAPAQFPYIPGYLAFRELPVIRTAWEGLVTKPDLLIFDGHGRAHPRRCGIACYGGVDLGVPSIGCAKSILVGEYGTLGRERGSTAPLVHDGETIGVALRTRDGVSPVYVSIGHMIDLDTAVSIILELTPRYRQPETTRRAHALVNQVRLGEP